MPRKVKIAQLTWVSGTGLVYEVNIQTGDKSNADSNLTPTNLQLVGTFDIDTTNGEGWGMVYHPTLDQFIVSDGTDNLHFWELRQDQNNNGGNLVFELVRTLPVQRRFSTTEAWSGVVRLNELEWDPYSYNGMTILANVWLTDSIVRIRLEDGIVTHEYQLGTLERPSSADVLNGIAAVWDSTTTSTATWIDMVTSKTTSEIE